MKFKLAHWEIVLFAIINILCVATLGFIMLMADYIPSFIPITESEISPSELELHERLSNFIFFIVLPLCIVLKNFLPYFFFVIVYKKGKVRYKNIFLKIKNSPIIMKKIFSITVICDIAMILFYYLLCSYKNGFSFDSHFLFALSIFYFITSSLFVAYFVSFVVFRHKWDKDFV